MSHIPSSAMPHAKPIEPEDGAAATDRTDGAAPPADTQPDAAATPVEPVTDATPVAAETPVKAAAPGADTARAAEAKPSDDAAAKRADPPREKDGGAGPGWGLIAALAGGVVALGAVAAAAVPLVRGHAAPKRERRERKADRKTRKAKAKG